MPLRRRLNNQPPQSGENGGKHEEVFSSINMYTRNITI